ncbi:hypothetical protein [Anderseniella sp. Alg231-50]|uniref:hypothetical protein n=1 Tax=Anderseniella sp. Alg231-50 TaxID=1922226 RepID=UPI00307B64C7
MTTSGTATFAIPAIAGCLILIAAQPSAHAASKRYCEKYVKQALAQQKRNINNRCGLTGSLWSDNFFVHAYYCTGASEVAAGNNRISRENALKACKPHSGEREDCIRMARYGLYRLKENRDMKCGYKGPLANITTLKDFVNRCVEAGALFGRLYKQVGATDDCAESNPRGNSEFCSWYGRAKVDLELKIKFRACGSRPNVNTVAAVRQAQYGDCPTRWREISFERIEELRRKLKKICK